eukprot:1084265-Pelagomonas_calceolata.AAC.3
MVADEELTIVNSKCKVNLNRYVDGASKLFQAKDKPPDCLMPPPDFALLPSTYPTLRDVSIRLLSRLQACKQAGERCGRRQARDRKERKDCANPKNHMP